MTGMLSNDFTDVVRLLDSRLDTYAKKAEKIGLISPYSLTEADKTEWYRSLGNLQYKTIGLAGRPSNTCIGGLCVIYSGDLTELMKGNLPNGKKLEDINQLKTFLDSLPRLDQIIESIGPTNARNYLVVYEDSLFAKLLASRLGFEKKLLEKMLKDTSIRSSELIKRWIKIASGEATVVDVYTSDIADDLDYYVAQLAEENGTRLDRDSNKVDLMYTYLWPKLLNTLG